jgi:Glycosyl hydrolases family 16
MSASNTLNTANYTTVWQDNFTTDSSLNSSLFPISWGNPDEFSFGSNGLTVTSDGTAAGFMNADLGATNGTGYGLYSATFTMTNQAAGPYVCLWPATNVWPGPEIDLAETLNGQPYLTVHWEGAGDTNQSQSFDFNGNLADPTTVAVDWEANSLTFYVDGQQVVQYTSGGSVPIPKDAADGGENESFGVGNVGPAGSSLTVSNLSYSAYTPGSSSSTDPSSTSTPTASSSPSSGSSSSSSSGTDPSGATAPITPATTGTSTTSFASTGDPHADWAQQLYTSPGTDILKGGSGLDTFTVDASSPDGWAQISHFHSGDVATILGFQQGTSTINWVQSTDPAGKSGATADISLAGNGTVNSAITFVGASVSQAESWSSGQWWSSNGTPELNVWKV